MDDKFKTLRIIMLSLLFFGVLPSPIEANPIKSTIIRGSVGSGNDQVGFKVRKTDGPYEAVPPAIALDTKGNVYIADIANERIIKFDGRGKTLFSITMKIERKRFYQIIDDMAVDESDNLYVASGHEQKIYKYNPDGTLIQTINLLEKELCWDRKKSWSRCPIQIQGLTVDTAGNIYLQGWKELVKLNSKGDVEAKWAGIRVYFLDEAGNAYLKKDSVWEKFDRNGNSKGIEKCQQPYFEIEKQECNYPRFIDKKGFLYYYELSQATNKGVMVKIDQKGKRYGEVSFEASQNQQKFDINGNLYIFNYADDKFWIEKINWN